MFYSVLVQKNTSKIVGYKKIVVVALAKSIKISVFYAINHPVQSEILQCINTIVITNQFYHIWLGTAVPARLISFIFHLPVCFRIMCPDEIKPEYPVFGGLWEGNCCNSAAIFQHVQYLAIDGAVA